MKMPGEDLLCKMWDSLANGGIGSLTSPWQIRREGKAHLDVRRQEMLTMAQTEADIKAIRNGHKALLSNGTVVDCDTENDINTKNYPTNRIEPTLSLSSLAYDATSTRLLRDSREEINTNKIIAEAERELLGSQHETPTENIEEDWLNRWHDCAKKISTEKLRSLWAKALAGEVKSPGRYSLRTLDFLKNLSQKEANLISKLAPFAIEDSIYKTESLEKNNIDFSLLLELDDLGILSGVKGGGLTKQLKSANNESFLAHIIQDNKALIISNEDRNKKLSLGCYKITAIGLEILSLGSFNSDINNLQNLALQIKALGFSVSIADAIPAPNNQVYLINPTSI